MTKKQLNKRLFQDDYFEEMIAQKMNCALDEFDPEINEDLLSGRDLTVLGGEWEDECLCLDSFLASQMISFY